MYLDSEKGWQRKVTGGKRGGGLRGPVDQRSPEASECLFESHWTSKLSDQEVVTRKQGVSTR